MTGIFFLTFFACIGVFIVFTLSHRELISPLTRIGIVVGKEISVAQVQAACNKTNLRCTNAVELPDGSIEVTVGDTTTVFLSPQKNIEKQLASLQQVASQLTIKGKTLKKVDFRFDQIIVSF
ncbi:MAG TPA: hypothetical protein VLB73_05075 [Patescibacteria group bacterium]|nr:hypothetical protein [Patescibacteria group bacterium]